MDFERSESSLSSSKSELPIFVNPDLTFGDVKKEDIEDDEIYDSNMDMAASPSTEEDQTEYKVTIKEEDLDKVEGREWENNASSTPTILSINKHQQRGFDCHSSSSSCKKLLSSKTSCLQKKSAKKSSFSPKTYPICGNHSAFDESANKDQHQIQRTNSRVEKEKEAPLSQSLVIKRKKRNYDENYIDLGFVCFNKQDESPRPQCVLCLRILANASMKPSSLRRHLHTNHPDCAKKPREFFLQRCQLMHGFPLNPASSLTKEDQTKYHVTIKEEDLDETSRLQNECAKKSSLISKAYPMCGNHAAFDESANKDQHQIQRTNSRVDKEKEAPLSPSLPLLIKSKKRKYDENYIDLGFVCFNKQDESPRPQCVLCLRILANASMKPSSLRRHLHTNHPDCAKKTREFFLQRRQLMQGVSLNPVEELIPQTDGVLDIYHSAAEKIISVTCKSHVTPSHDMHLNCSPHQNTEDSQVIKIHEIDERSMMKLDSYPIDVRRGKKRNLIRKYDDNYIEFGFACLYYQNTPRPQCVLCSRILANESMRPSNLKRHLLTNHPVYASKPRAFFQQLLDKMRDSTANILKEMSFSRTPPVKELSFTKKALMTSYLVSLRIAKSKKAHVIGKTLIQPAAMEICEKVLGRDAADQIKTIPLSNSTVRRRITDLAEDVKGQLLEKVRCSPCFALLLDESMDIANIAQLFCYVRFKVEKEVVEDLLLYQDVSPLTSGVEVFELLNNLFAREGLEWRSCVGFCSDGSAAMTGEVGGFVQRVHDVAPHSKWIHCFMKRESLASMDLGPAIHESIEAAVKLVSLIKLRLVDSACFRLLCEELGEDHRHLLINTELRWLSRGNVLTRLFNMRDELWTIPEVCSHGEHLKDPRFMAHLAYLSVVLGEVNSCYSSLPKPGSILLDLGDQIANFMAKIHLWKREVSVGSTKVFELLDAYLAERQDANLKASVLKDIQDHLAALQLQTEHNFRYLNCDHCDWIRTPFSVTVESVNHLPMKAQEEFINLRYNRQLQETLTTQTVAQFWSSITQDYPRLWKEAMPFVIPFASTALSEAGFLAMAEMKSKFRNRLAIGSDLRLCLTNIEPNIKRLCEERQAQPSH